MPAQFTSPPAAAERDEGAEVSWHDAGLGEGVKCLPLGQVSTKAEVIDVLVLNSAASSLLPLPERHVIEAVLGKMRIIHQAWRVLSSFHHPMNSPQESLPHQA
ncbi:uncharacterized protein LOC135111978 [Scylla paramamosain]|uniref:uncharacterized protein LOC135111978 n=1 Tax=Scylla paramamosain TaxID=85552 RepID=UPI003082FEE0